MSNDEYQITKEKIVAISGILIVLIGMLLAFYFALPDYYLGPINIQPIPFSLSIMLIAVGIAFAVLGWRASSHPQHPLPKRFKSTVTVLIIFTLVICCYPTFQAVSGYVTSIRPVVSYELLPWYSSMPNGSIIFGPDSTISYVYAPGGVGAVMVRWGTNGNPEFNLTLKLENATFLAAQTETAGDYILDNSTLVFPSSSLVGDYYSYPIILYRANDNVTSFSILLSCEVNGTLNNIWTIKAPWDTQINYTLNLSQDIFVISSSPWNQ